MTEWTTMTTKFTEEEMQFIRPIMKAYNLDNYNFLRQAALVGTSMVVLTHTLATNSAIEKSLEPILRPILEKLGKQLEGKETKMKAKIDPDILKEAEREVDFIKQSKEVFEKHDRRGPKSDPHTRGRHPIHSD